MTGKVVLVTGAGRGIGRAIALALINFPATIQAMRPAGARVGTVEDIDKRLRPDQ